MLVLVNILFYGPLLWIIPHIYDTNTIILKKDILLSGYFFPFVHNVNFHSREDMTIFSEYQYLCKSIGYFHLPLPLVVYNCPDFQKKSAFKRWSIAWGGISSIHINYTYIYSLAKTCVCDIVIIIYMAQTTITLLFSLHCQGKCSRAFSWASFSIEASEDHK